MSQRHSNNYDFVKCRVCPGMLPVEITGTIQEPLDRKGGPKGAFLKIPKIVKGSPKQLFIKVRHWDPLKMVPGTCFGKHKKTIVKSMYLDGPKPLKNIETLLDFWSLPNTMKKLRQRGSQNSDIDLPGSTLPLIFDILV